MDEIFSLDFFKKTVTYQGEVLPTGTLACEALNISNDVIAAFTEPAGELAAVFQHLILGTDMDDCIDGIREIVFGMLEGLSATPPFHRLNIDQLRAKAAACITPATARRLIRHGNDISYTDARNGNLSPADQKMLDFADIARQISLFGLGLQSFRQKVFSLAEQCNDDLYAGSPADYALAYAASGGDKELAMNDAFAAFSGVSTSYVAMSEPTRIVRRMYFSNAAAMLRADFFEGLMVGHAPKKCRICGKWFLTTDAHRAAYCDGYAPDDPGGRTCRQIGAKLGREEREKADNHPVRKIYQHTINAINQRLHRGTITEETAVAARKLAKEHMERAVTDHSFAANEYKQRMKVDTLLSEATQ